MTAQPGPRVVVNRTAGDVVVGGGFFLPASADVVVTEMDGLAYDVYLTVELVDGRYECTALTCSQRSPGSPVTTNGLRSLPVGRIIEMGMAPLVEGDWATAAIGGSDPARVAMVYRLAYACRLPPTTAVARAFELSLSDAGNRVMAARRAGLLGPTTSGKASAGEWREGSASMDTVTEEVQ